MIGMQKIPAGPRLALSLIALTAWSIVAACGEVTTEPTTTSPTASSTATAADEEAIAHGVYTEYIIDINGGSMVFDVYVPEDTSEERAWGKGAIVEIYEGGYRDGQGTYGALLPYKMKTCEARDCYEPRYNVKWDQWHHIKFEWDRTGISAEIYDAEGKIIEATVAANWRRGASDGMKLIYGNMPGGPLLVGSRYKNIKITGATEVK